MPSNKVVACVGVICVVVQCLSYHLPYNSGICIYIRTTILYVINIHYTHTHTQAAVN